MEMRAKEMKIKRAACRTSKQIEFLHPPGQRPGLQPIHTTGFVVARVADPGGCFEFCKSLKIQLVLAIAASALCCFPLPVNAAPRVGADPFIDCDVNGRTDCWKMGGGCNQGNLQI